MKRFIAVLLVVVMFVMTMPGCSGLSKMMREATAQSTTEFVEWNKVMKAKIEALPTEEVKSFFIYFTEIVGEDKKRLPIEAFKIMDDIGDILATKDAKDFTIEDKAKLVGKWDRFWIVLMESAGKSIINYFMERISL